MLCLLRGENTSLRNRANISGGNYINAPAIRGGVLDILPEILLLNSWRSATSGLNGSVQIVDHTSCFSTKQVIGRAVANLGAIDIYSWRRAYLNLGG